MLDTSKKTYVVDIDGTVCKTVNGDYFNSEFDRERIRKINDLYYQGNTIIYYTARGANSGDNWFEVTLASLKEAGAKFDELRMGKLAYDVWIDDKAINEKDFFQ